VVVTHSWPMRTELYYLLTHRAQPLFRSCKLCSHSKTSQHFMEPELCSQEPSTDFYPEPNQSNASHPFSLKSSSVWSTDLHHGLPSGLFSSRFPINILFAYLFPIHATCTAHLIFIDLIILIILGEEYKL
jgi:hypothetical protein